MPLSHSGLRPGAHPPGRDLVARVKSTAGLGYVNVMLDDGGVVELSRAAAEDLYDLLWMLALDERGAVTTAAKLRSAFRRALLGDDIVRLDATESAAFVAAQSRL